MEEERRQSSIDAVLQTLGEVKQVGLENAKNIASLVEKVSIQNGRVGKMELAYAENKGAMKVINCIFLFVIAPTFVALAVFWITNK
jgi:hypothetical protein